MRNKKIVNNIMKQISPAIKYIWCDHGPCACMGCINRSVDYTKLGCSPITKEEYERWLEDNEIITSVFDGMRIIDLSQFDIDKLYMLHESMKFEGLLESDIYKRAVNDLCNLDQFERSDFE